MTKTKRPYAQMYAIACGLVERLRPACDRIEIAGSLRRQRPEVGDIEIVAIPRPLYDLLGEPLKRTELDVLLDGWPIEFSKRGPKYNQFSFCGKSGERYQVDLFLPSADTWGVVYMIRTGSSAFSHKMVTPQMHGGWMPNQYKVSEGRVWLGDKALDTPEENNVFQLWDMAWIAPPDRDTA